MRLTLVSSSGRAGLIANEGSALRFASPASSVATGSDVAPVRALPCVAMGVALCGGTQYLLSTSADRRLARSVSRTGFELGHEGDVRLRVFDLNGRHVATILDERGPAGRSEVTWSLLGRESAHPGLYVVRLDAAGTSVSRRLVATR